MAGTCQHHEQMIENQGKKVGRGEFWTILVPALAFVFGAIGIVYSASATNEKVDLLDRAAEERTLRIETLLKSELQQMNDRTEKRFDKIDQYLRSGTDGSRYR